MAARFLVARVERNDGLLERVSNALVVNTGENDLVRAAAARWLAAAAAHEAWCARVKHAASCGALPGRSSAGRYRVLLAVDDAVLDAAERYAHDGSKLVLRELLQAYEESTRQRLDYMQQDTA